MNKLLTLSFYNQKGYESKEFSYNGSLDCENKIKLWLYELYVEKQCIRKPLIDCITFALKHLQYTDQITFGSDKVNKDEHVAFTMTLKEVKKQ